MSNIDNESDSVTAVDFITNQVRLEREARELMPYDPNECTYTKGELRQPIFACLTCSAENANEPIGVCYSCSIQCHSSHDIVELFTKRGFVCDCGTTKMAKTTNGACKLRRKSENSRRLSFGSSSGVELELPAEDIPGSNSYNQNYKGTFCSCKQPYNPAEETGDMLQCYFGFECGEDWYHDRCILGVDKSAVTPNSKLKYFPELDNFDVFICWKCVDRFKPVFEELDKHSEIVYAKIPHIQASTVDEWFDHKESLESDEPTPKKIKLDTASNGNQVQPQYSYFLVEGFRDQLTKLYTELPPNEPLHKFLSNNTYLFQDDPIYEPPSDDEDSDTGSILDMGTDALHSLPRQQAIEGLQAYENMKSKLHSFFKPFAEQGKIVTEDEVRQFFGSMTEERKHKTS
ncbi:Protein mlo2 [Spathaspora sp. JA1]|nr:Protein mlo2 [Spathaspora sp. JA1]